MVVFFLRAVVKFVQSLERAQLDGDEIKASVQFVLAPMVLDQVSLELVCAI